MKSNVTFDLVEAIKVGTRATYPSLAVIPQMEGDVWTALLVEVEHADTAGASEIVDAARQRARILLTAVGVGRGLEPAIGTAHLRTVSALQTDAAIGQVQFTCGGYVIRPLRAMPSESLVCKLAEDPKLCRQADALNAARASADAVSRIRWSYMVLEQEGARKQGYTPPDDFKYLRHGVSHPELSDPRVVAYFQGVLGADIPDLKNASHLEFLAVQAQAVIEEATRIVEEKFCGDEFWQ
jgi:hypothetical protein